MQRAAISGVVLLALAACGGSEGDGGGGGTGEPAPYCARSFNDRREAVCQAWTCATQDPPTPAWTGDVATCAPGDDPALREAAVRLTNAYRLMAGLPAVSGNPTSEARAQQCAVMQHANHSLSHEPPDDWLCRTTDAVVAAGSSNVATADGYEAVHLYMEDGGANNASTLGHRRWILSPPLETVGVGTTDGYSCMWVVHPFEVDTRPFVSWPPAGPVPAEVVHGATPLNGSLDRTGWSVQSNRIDFARATVTVTEDGVEKPVKTVALGANYGSRYALKIVPDGWKTQIGPRYAVQVDGVSQPVSWEFELVDCSIATAAR